MNATVFWRILWKEYRAQRSFWISVAVLTLVVELLLRAGPWNTGPEAIEAMLLMAPLFSVLYGLGSGATLFATEREAETYDFLRALPAKPLVVFAGKVAFAIASTAAMFFVVWTLALALARGLPDPRPDWHIRQVWILWGFAGAELIAWGILFSLLLKRTLMAAILAGTVMSITSIWLMMAAGSPEIMLGRLLILVFLAMADVALAARWFRERWFSPARPRDRRLSEGQIEAIFNRVLPPRPHGELVAEATAWAFVPSPPARIMLSRLLWQELRQSTAMTAALIVMLLPAILFLWLEWTLGIHQPRLGGHWFAYSLIPLMFASFLSPPLLGSSLFLADQMNCRFRFLAEHGIPPRLVWLSRQIRGLTVMLLGLVLVLPPIIGLAATRPSSDDVLAIQSLLGSVALAYACGQLCSIGFRSGIVAAAFGTVLTILLCWWAGIMYLLGLSWLWTVAPLPLAFLVATCVRAPDWLLERTTWRAWLRPALVIAVPALAILVAIPLVRVYEIPLVDPGFDARGLTLAWPVPREQQERLTQEEIRICQQRMQWAAQSGRKAQEVIEALRTLEKQWRNRPMICENIQQNYLRNLRFLEGDREALTELRGNTAIAFYFELTRWLPWERARAVRLLNKRTAEQFAQCRHTDAALAAGGNARPPSQINASPALPKDFASDLVTRIMAHASPGDCLMVETYRRATRLILALEAWKLEHGALPESLDDLKGKYLDRLPVDPYTGSAFRYEPKGLPHGVEWRSPNSPVKGTLEPGRPFIACSSWSSAWSSPPQRSLSWGGATPPMPVAGSLGGSPGRAMRPPEPPEGGAVSPTPEVWDGVWVFPIP